METATGSIEAVSERKEDGPILTPDQLLEAARKMIFNFPTVVRKWQDPPNAGQMFVVYTILNRAEPKILPSGKKVYAYIKVSGVTPTLEEAETLAKKILNEVHSKFPIRIGEVGVFHPVTDDASMARDMLALSSASETGGGASGEKKLYDEVAAAAAKDDAKKIREIREKAAELEKSGDVYDDPASIRFYATKRNTEKFLTENIESLREKLQKMEETRRNVWTDCRAIESIHPEYIAETVNAEGVTAAGWIHFYNSVRAESGLPAWIPSESQFKDYLAWVPDTPPVFDADKIRGYRLSDIPEAAVDRLIRLRKEGKVVDASPSSTILKGGGAADG